MKFLVNLRNLLVGHVERGCFNELTVNSTECEASEACEICSGSNCNQNVFPLQRLMCHVCSGDANSTCAGEVNTTMTYCSLYVNDDNCYTARPAGNYERGCMSLRPNTDRCTGDESCFICPGNGCNFGEYNSAINIFSGAKMIPFLLLSVVVAVQNK